METSNFVMIYCLAMVGGLIVCVCVCACAWVNVCACVCRCERERWRQSERMGAGVSFPCAGSHTCTHIPMKKKKLMVNIESPFMSPQVAGKKRTHAKRSSPLPQVKAVIFIEVFILMRWFLLPHRSLKWLCECLPPSSNYVFRALIFL